MICSSWLAVKHVDGFTIIKYKTVVTTVYYAIFLKFKQNTNGEKKGKKGQERKRPKFNIVQSIISFQKQIARSIEWQWIFLVIANAALCIQTLLAIWPEEKKSYEILVAVRWWRIDERSMNLHKFTAIYFILFHSHSCIKPSMHRNRFLIRWHIKTQIERWTSVLL